MRKIFIATLATFMIISPARCVMADELDKLAQATDKLWNTGAGAEDGAFTAVACSMLAWGVGLAAVIALLAILINNSEASSNVHTH